MRRSERLTAIVERLGDGRLHLARDLAERFEVSARTIYRDMDALVASGVPVEGERGLGYLLREPVFLPALFVGPAELEALHLGMAIVAEAADEELARASRSLLGKIRTKAREASPAAPAPPSSWGFEIYPFVEARAGFVHMPTIRRAVRDARWIEIDYLSLRDARSSRRVRPLQVEYWGRVWTLSAWCELRGTFRSFRVDRIEACRAETERFDPHEPGKGLKECLAALETTS